jgi:hypothetical protein
MKAIENLNTRLEYTSELGDNFLLMDEWAIQNLNDSEMAIYRNEELTQEKQNLFNRWMSDQKITSLKTFVDGVQQTG